MHVYDKNLVLRIIIVENLSSISQPKHRFTKCASEEEAVVSTFYLSLQKYSKYIQGKII